MGSCRSNVEDCIFVLKHSLWYTMESVVFVLLWADVMHSLPAGNMLSQGLYFKIFTTKCPYLTMS